jgi:hypothetical protein
LGLRNIGVLGRVVVGTWPEGDQFSQLLSSKREQWSDPSLPDDDGVAPTFGLLWNRRE